MCCSAWNLDPLVPKNVNGLERRSASNTHAEQHCRTATSANPHGNGRPSLPGATLRPARPPASVPSPRGHAPVRTETASRAARASATRVFCSDSVTPSPRSASRRAPVFEVIGEAQANGEEARILGCGTFGTFGTRSRPARTGRNLTRNFSVRMDQFPGSRSNRQCTNT